MRAASRTLITIATYNEIENLPRLVARLFELSPDFHILVIDDNSPDGTGRWCDAAGSEDERLHCLHRPEKSGLGTALAAGLQYAIEHNYEYALNMDADFSHDPEHIPSLLDAIEDADGQRLVDLVIGSRYVPGGGTPGWPLQRRVISRAINIYTRCLLGLRVRDCSGGFRCYRAEALKKIDFGNIRSRGYSFQEEILWLLRRSGAKFVEVPIVFRDRTEGTSKITLRDAFGALDHYQTVVYRPPIVNAPNCA